MSRFVAMTEGMIHDRLEIQDALASSADLTHPPVESGICKKRTQLPSPTAAGSHSHCPTGLSPSFLSLLSF